MRVTKLSEKRGSEKEREGEWEKWAKVNENERVV